GNGQLNLTPILGMQEADIDNRCSPAFKAEVMNEPFDPPAANRATAKLLLDADQNTTRLVKKAEAFFAVLPPGAPEFNHFAPAGWLFFNPGVLDQKTPEVNETLDRAEKVIAALNKLL